MNIFDLLREKDHQAESESTRASLIERVAHEFEPKEDISSYEMAMLFKIFAMLSVDSNIDEVKALAQHHNLTRHFTFKS